MRRYLTYGVQWQIYLRILVGMAKLQQSLTKRYLKLALPVVVRVRGDSPDRSGISRKQQGKLVGRSSS
jgi:hypothetical protein